MKNTSEILESLKASDIQKVKLAITDIDGILRGKLISKDKFFKTVNDKLGFCNVVFGWDANDAVYDNSEVTGWHTGFPDSMASIDLITFRKIPWDNNTPFFLGDFHQSEDIEDVCPRSLLKKIAAQSGEMGFIPKFSNEFEWFNFKETPQSLKDKDGIKPTPLTPGMFGYSILRSSQNSEYFNELFDLLTKFGIPIEGIHTETGDGVYEACIEYTDVLEAADRAVLFKTGVKEIAYRHEIIASFMAKWNTNLPGCSGHIHQSLWDEKEKNNLFFDGKDSNKMSDTLKHYLAGQLHCLPHILPMYAPTVNSYKRLVEGSWAATSVSWGIENRTTAMRVINHGEDSMRLETRVPGADANPYLSMAASLASGLYGIKNKLPLNIEPTQGNEYDNEATLSLPKTLTEATEQMKSSDIATELFGESFVNHFIKTREWEWQQFNSKVTDWELKRYFEII
ncbi:glutamine synthetase family protein [Gracilimonas sp.]|uniref:glutamine synthetase family protein n=1 Tax=Gracilimonas sp. TaxID=1974203 RepID=UPI0032ED1A51